MADKPTRPCRRRFCRGVAAGLVGAAAGCDGRFPAMVPGSGSTSDLAAGDASASVSGDLAGACGAAGNIVAGPASQIAVGSATLVGAGRRAAGVFICRDPLGLYALSPLCTHQACNITFVDAASGFHCPCHGSMFDFAGDVTVGPAPRSLAHYLVCIDDAGNVTVDSNAVVDGSVRVTVQSG